MSFKNNKVFKAVCCMLTLLAILAGSVACYKEVYAANVTTDGAYIAGRTTSYVNPETGQTYDGGSNIALGDSMCASIVAQNVLIERYQGKTYVTVGFGLMSNISNIRMAVQTSAGGDYSSVAATQTGTVVKDGDNCNQYRFEMSSTDLYIRPTFYVDPMGRDVTFYIKLNTDSLSAGTGEYYSEFYGTSSDSANTTGNAGFGITGSTAGSSNETIAQTSVVQNNRSSNDTTATADTWENAAAEESPDNLAKNDATSREATETATQNAAEAVDTANSSADLSQAKGLSVHQINAGTAQEASQKSRSSIGIIVTVIVVILVAAAGILFYIRRKNILRSADANTAKTGDEHDKNE